jgi:hypothetical protein
MQLFASHLNDDYVLVCILSSFSIPLRVANATQTQVFFPFTAEYSPNLRFNIHRLTDYLGLYSSSDSLRTLARRPISAV